MEVRTMNEYVNKCTLVDKVNLWYEKRQGNVPFFFWVFAGVVFCVQVIAGLRSPDNWVLLEGSMLLLELSFFVYVCKKLFFTRSVSE